MGCVASCSGGDDCTLRAPRTPMRPLSPARERGQGLASSAAEGETMLAGAVQEKHAWVRPLGQLHSPKLSFERCPWRPDLPAGNGARVPPPLAQPLSPGC